MNETEKLIDSTITILLESRRNVLSQGVSDVTTKVANDITAIINSIARFGEPLS